MTVLSKATRVRALAARRGEPLSQTPARTSPRALRSVRDVADRRLGCGVWRLVSLVFPSPEGVDGTKTSDSSQIAVKLFRLGRKSLCERFTEGDGHDVVGVDPEGSLSFEDRCGRRVHER